MRSIVFLITGIILMATGAFAYFLIGKIWGGVPTEGLPASLDGLGNILRYGVGGFVGGLGALFSLGGLIGLARGSTQGKQQGHIMQNGVDAQASVTFVDKNYSIQVNRRPIYSIVEYTYVDSSGIEHTARFDKIKSEQVIRSRIQVGATIAIKYSSDNPAQSVIVT